MIEARIELGSDFYRTCAAFAKLSDVYKFDKLLPMLVASILNSDDIDIVSEGLYDLRDYAEEKKTLKKVETCVKETLASQSTPPRMEIIEAINNVISLGDQAQHDLVWRQTSTALAVFGVELKRNESTVDLVSRLTSQWTDDNNAEDDVITNQFKSLWNIMTQVWQEDYAALVLLSLIEIPNKGDIKGRLS